MKEVNKYVEDLLYRHQCVIIPEFGAFISNRKSAIIGEDKTFSPPSKKLTFNSRLISNDGLLIKYISENEKITYEVAQFKVRQSVEKWKKELASGEVIKFENIGFLQQNTEGNITFLPLDKTDNLLTDSFGMSSFVPQEVQKVEEEKQSPVINPILDEGQKVDSSDKKEKKSRGYLKYVAIIILGIIAISYGIFLYFNSDNNSNITDTESVQKQIENHISEATFLSETPLELPSISLNVVKGEENRLEEVSTENTEEGDTTKKVSSKLRFHVIAGAFRSEANAKTRVKQLKKEGYKSSIVGKNSKGLYQVCYQSFSTQSEADKFSKNIKINKKLDSWILETK